MLTTFGPTLNETPKLSTMNKNDLASTFRNPKDDHRGDEDIEMTFGHYGNTSVSNQSLRASQFQYQFGSTFR